VTEGFTSAPGGFAVGSRIAGYLLEEQIGQGGMAVVFRAHDERLDRRVALKILAPALAADEAFRQRFIRESRAAAAVDDPHIIPVFEAGEASGVLFIAMRYVRGGDVRSLVTELGVLPPRRAAEIVSQVASALDAAHASGLVHRDVKPANMLLAASASAGRPDHVYLSDFGLSKASLQASGLTGTGMFLGTLDYIAPEQLEGKPVDGRADEYALACAAFELLSGAPPFHSVEPTAVMYAQLSDPPPRLTSRRPDLPPAVDEVFARALAKAPASRYATCQEFSDAMRDALRITRHDPAPDTGRPPNQQVWPDDRTAGAGEPVTDAYARPGRPATSRPTKREPVEWEPVEQAHGRRSRRRPITLAGVGIVVVALAVAVLRSHILTGPPPPGSGAACQAGHGSVGHRSANPAAFRLADTLTDPGGGHHIVEAAVFSLAGTTLMVGDATGSTYLWDTSTGQVTSTLTDPAAKGVLAVSPSCDGTTLAVGDADGSTYLWDVSTGHLIAVLTDPDTGKRGVQAVAFSPDGKTLAVGDSNGTTYLRNAGTGKVTATLADPGSANVDVQAVAFSPDAAMVATGDADGSSYLWDAGTGRLVATLTDPGPVSKDVQAIAFSPDGGLLAAGDSDGSTYVWDTGTGRLVATLADSGTGSLGVVAVEFSPDGTVLAAGDSDGSTFLWDTGTDSLVRTLTDPSTQGVQAVAFSPDGTMIATGDANGSSYLWNAG
jgi:serine/threonine protein kinase